MEIDGKTVLVCNCEDTMRLDAVGLAKALGCPAATVYSNLCRAQLGEVQRALLGERPVIVACTQEAPLFAEARDQTDPAAEIAFVNIREHAGWSAEAPQATPKIAALIAEAALEIPPTRALTLESGGAVVVLGRDEAAIEAARTLSSRLDATVILDRPAEVMPPRVSEAPIFRGTVAAARGHLGAFSLDLRDLAPSVPSARRSLAFGPAEAKAEVGCDLILDLTGGAPLFPAPEKRDGYFRPAPGDPAALARALYELVDLVGTFEKPIYVEYAGDLCAHGRSGKVGCTRCLDACPAGAITAAGDLVAIDGFVCGGCGNCASVCPTGAASYTLPARDPLFQRLRTVLATYRGAGGENPAILVHDGAWGDDAIHLAARFGRGLPARVIPFAVNETTQVGLDFLLAALAYGAAEVRLLVPPSSRAHAAALAGEAALAAHIAAALGYGEGRVAVIDEDDPAAIEGALYALPGLEPAPPSSFLPMGGKRTVTALALAHLHEHAPTPAEAIALPEGAPFGAVRVRAEGCTLCLACVGACPTGALLDNPDAPMLRFREEACVQCGLCRATCPERVITLEPRLDFTEAARTPRVLKEEAPFHCVRCGKPFGVRASVERMVEKLAGHPMFAGQALDRIRMCDDCRVIAQFEAPQAMALRPRPAPRTTEDDLREREQAKARALHERAARDGDDG